MTGQKELAIALRYTEALPAPLVVASGRGAVARAIARIAAEGGVPLVEDPPLADSMIALEAGALIPESLYEAVAVLLAFVSALETEQ
jgi:type III secretion system FlhB-like substrate exporter